MRLLLDTHIAIWALLDSPRLPDGARALILDGGNSLYVSAAAIWEVAIKRAKFGAKSGLPIPALDMVGLLKEAGYEVLTVRGDHAAAVEGLPRHHGDPFDRLMVAQAMIEPMRLVSSDQTLAAYSAPIEIV